MPRPLPAQPADAEDFFAGSPLGLAVFRRVNDLVIGLGGCDLRVAKTQVGWARRRGFAVLWLPGRWLTAPAAEVVLTVYLTHPSTSSRWKQVVEVRPGLFAHHCEVHGVGDVDPEVEGWLAEAYRAAE